ncbi:hypothetical protein [Fodinicola acaciae]|uniref:hypothetical protein n=1 Tax=Fodinicola acaciae TaxID=2681555 RepID=UPI0013D54C72|nr:hypothetical protein [Fodinicola acaciae]
MRKRLASVLVTGIATAALAFASAPAQADDTWTVTGSPGTLTATAGVTTLKDGNVTLTCQSATAGGTIANGSGQAGAGIASITSAAFNTCSGPAGLTFTVQPGLPWSLNAVSYDGSDVVTGTITNVSAHLQGPACTADVTGSVAGTYTNSTAVLKVDPALNGAQGTQLTVSNVVNCLGLMHNGDHPTFSASYQVSPATIHITSP